MTEDQRRQMQYPRRIHEQLSSPPGNFRGIIFIPLPVIIARVHQQKPLQRSLILRGGKFSLEVEVNVELAWNFQAIDGGAPENTWQSKSSRRNLVEFYGNLLSMGAV